MYRIEGKKIAHKLGLMLLFIVWVFYSLACNVSAHEAQSDGEIGAILHVDPNDDPVAGVPATLYLEFTDMQNKLALNSCNCRIIIKKNNEEIFTQKFQAADGSFDSAVISFTFPEAGIYKARISGEPMHQGEFQPFNLNFSIRAERAFPKSITEAHKQPGNSLADHIFHYLPTVIVLSILVVMLIFIKNKKKLFIIFLAIILISHTIPVKAIHASHGGLINDNAYHCCLFSAAVMPEGLGLEFPVMAMANGFVLRQLCFVSDFLNSLLIRPPPSL